MTKQNIKEEILRKLNFDTAPSWQNVSITQSPVIKNWIKKVEFNPLFQNLAVTVIAILFF